MRARAPRRAIRSEHHDHAFIALDSTATGNTAGSPSTAGTNTAGDHVYLSNISRRTVIDIVRGTTGIRFSHISPPFIIQNIVSTQ